MARRRQRKLSTLAARLATIAGRSDRGASYYETLEAAWAAHLAPKAANARTVISTFAGCGGSSLGYSMSGYREALAVEIDTNAQETLRDNFPGVPVYAGDIAELTATEAMDLAGVGPGELDVFDGSPPCQGFSTAGNRADNDPRNQLFRQYARLLTEMQPRAFVMENVTGLVRGKMKVVFGEILKALTDCGYSVQAATVSAAWYGVPQERNRVIFIGLRNDLGQIPTNPFPKANRSRIASGDACANLGTPAHRYAPEHEAQRAELVEKCKDLTSFEGWDRINPGENLNKLYPGKVKGFGATRINAERPAHTITCMDGTLGMFGSMHWSERRRPTIAEVKRLFSFPDDFKLHGSFKEQYKRLGNSVPPLMMRAISANIRDILAVAEVTI